MVAYNMDYFIEITWKIRTFTCIYDDNMPTFCAFAYATPLLHLLSVRNPCVLSRQDLQCLIVNFNHRRMLWNIEITYKLVSFLHVNRIVFNGISSNPITLPLPYLISSTTE